MNTVKLISTKRKSPQGEQVSLYVRSDTTDEKAVKEVIEDNCYQKPRKGFTFSLADNWLDLGANIGAFSVWVLLHGAKSVYALEPEESNIELLETNLRYNSDRFTGEYHFARGAVVPQSHGKDYVELYLCKGEYNKYRHSTEIIGNKKEKVKVPAISLERLLDRLPVDGVKMDIEGSEIEILEEIEDKYLHQLNALVFEYSFDADRSIPRFLRIINKLEDCFGNVHYTKVKSDQLEYRYYPPCTNVYCW